MKWGPVIFYLLETSMMEGGVVFREATKSDNVLLLTSLEHLPMIGGGGGGGR